MKKQDRCRVRTASDLEQKYDLGGLVGNATSNARLEEQVRLLNQTLAQHIANSNARFDEIETIGTHFYSGVPSLLNEPANNWDTEELLQEHVGDMYYDTDNGYTYLFKYTDGTYEWVKCFSGIENNVQVVHEITDVVPNTKIEVTFEPELPENTTLVGRSINSINADADTECIQFANFVGVGLESNTFVLKSTASHSLVQVYVTYFYTLNS